MTDIKVQKVEKPEDRALPIFEQVGKLMERVQRRAYELFSGRGAAPGGALDDWLAAGRELCWPAAELSENAQEFELDVALPGFDAAQVSVAATPRELTVHAIRKDQRAGHQDNELLWSEFGSEEVCRCVQLAQPIDVAKVTATLSQGMLKVVAKKAVAQVVPIPVAAAA